MPSDTTLTSPTAESAAPMQTRSITRHFPTVARFVLGALLLVCALNGVLNFIPQPKMALPDAAAAFNMGMMKTGYMFPLIFGTQGLVGVLLLLNRFVPLALALLAPFLVNAFAFHVFLVHEGLVVVSVFVALELYLAWTYRAAYRPMLQMKTPL